MTLQGVLRSGQVFGPPNYGEVPESDRLVDIWYLQLPATVGVQTPSQLDMRIQTSYFVQIHIPKVKTATAKALVNKKVKVTGHLYEALLAHEHFPGSS